MWEIDFTDEYLQWIDTLSKEVQEKILEGQELLEEEGPNLRRPHVGTLRKSQYKKLKELIVQFGGRPIRIAFIFGEDRRGVFLIGAYKDGPHDKKFYERFVALAERIYKKYKL